MTPENIKKMLAGVDAAMETAARLNEADSETLWALVQDLAQKTPSTLPKAVMNMAKEKNWSVQHTALALAYAMLKFDIAVQG